MTETAVTTLAVRTASIFFMVMGTLGLAEAALGLTGLDTGHLWWVGTISIAIGVTIPLLPFPRWSRSALLAIAVSALLLLLVVDAVTDYSASRQAAAVYPAYVIMILTWVGLSQPRTVALAFTACVGAVCAYTVLAWDGGVIPLSALLLVLPAGAVLGEGAAWVMGRLRWAASRDRRRAHDLEVLSGSLAQLTVDHSVEDAAQMVARVARQIFSSRFAIVTLADANSQPTTIRSGPQSIIPTLETDAFVGRSLGGFDPTVVYEDDERSTLAIALRGSSRTVGMVVVEQPRHSDLFVLNMAHLFSAQIGTAIEQFQRIETLDRAAHRDVLTGMGNRRHATHLLESMRRGDTLLLIDLDQLKEVNDTEGHQAGDLLLKRLGAYLQSYVRGTDDVARYGGDEFIVITRSVGADAQAAADRLLRGWRALQPRSTVSIGVALLTEDGSATKTLSDADRALYDAKGSGRNRVCMHTNGEVAGTN